jgi:hypothetical protein
MNTFDFAYNDIDVLTMPPTNPLPYIKQLKTLSVPGDIEIAIGEFEISTSPIVTVKSNRPLIFKVQSKIINPVSKSKRDVPFAVPIEAAIGKSFVH